MRKQKKTICYKMKVIADAIIEQQKNGQICPSMMKELKEISEGK